MIGVDDPVTRASDDNRTIAKKVAQTFGGQPTVLQYHDSEENHSVHVATRADCPTTGVSSYSTLGLSDSPLIQDGEEFNTRLEILAGCESGIEYFANAMSTAAFYIIKDRRFCAPGYVFENILNEYDHKTMWPHFYFTSPFLWDDVPGTMWLPGKVVSFLQAMPISESERQYLVEHGDDALETLFEQNDVDVCDLTRQPVA